MPIKPKKKTTTTASKKAEPRADSKQVSLVELVKQLDSFTVDNYWDLGRFLVEKVMPAARKQGMFEEQVLKMIASHPGAKFPFGVLKQCQQYYTYYPDVSRRPLGEVFYFDLATKVSEQKKRDQYEKQAVDLKWTISDLRKKIHDDEMARRIDERTKYGFELRERNVWSFDAPDPRFGKPNFKGRIPGQIVANCLYYYSNPSEYVVDPFAGSGTLGDIIDSLPYFQDRKYRMYDLEPSDDRIVRNNILLTGVPEQSATVDFMFIDPPAEFMQKDTTSGFDGGFDAARADFTLKFKGIVRECTRVLKSGGRASIIVEPAFSRTEFLDMPYEITQMFKEAGFRPIGKVYLPRRSGESGGKGSPAVSELMGIRMLNSDCRELLTFKKL